MTVISLSVKFGQYKFYVDFRNNIVCIFGYLKERPKRCYKKKIENHLEIKSAFNFIEITDKGVPSPALQQSLVDIIFLTIV